MQLKTRIGILLITYTAICLFSLLCITPIVHTEAFSYNKLSSETLSNPFFDIHKHNGKLKYSNFVTFGNLDNIQYKDISFNTPASNMSKTNVCNNNTAIAQNKTGQNLNILPPNISMIYNGKKYYTGNLLNYKYREGVSLSQLNLPMKKINSSLPSKSIVVLKGDCLGFAIENDPSALPPDSLSVDAYKVQAKSQVLAIAQNAKSVFFKTNLSEGQYVILVVVTWLPGNEDVSGYEEYNFLINVKDGNKS